MSLVSFTSFKLARSATKLLYSYPVSYKTASPLTSIKSHNNFWYCTHSTSHVPIIPSKSIGQDGYVRVSPEQMKRDIAEGERALILDARPVEEYQFRHLVGSINIPYNSFVKSDFEGMPTNRPVYVVTGPYLTEAIKVADAATLANAESVSIVEAEMDAFPDAGFMYYYDVDSEQARLKKIEEEKAAAEAAKKAAQSKL